MFRLDVIGLDTLNSLLAELLPADFRGHNLIILKRARLPVLRGRYHETSRLVAMMQPQHLLGFVEKQPLGCFVASRTICRNPKHVKAAILAAGTRLIG